MNPSPVLTPPSGLLVNAAGVSPHTGKARNWREAMAACLGAKLDQMAQEIVEMSQAIMEAGDASKAFAEEAAANNKTVEEWKALGHTPAAVDTSGISDEGFAKTVAESPDSPSAMLMLTAKVGTFTTMCTMAQACVTKANEGEGTLARAS